MLLMDVFCLMQWAALGRFLPLGTDRKRPKTDGQPYK